MICGGGGQVWYGATWIHSRRTQQELDAEFHSHPQTELRWTLNGETIPLKASAYKEVAKNRDQLAIQRVTLRAGWNEVRFRGYCVGYPPFHAGLVLTGLEEKLWPLKLSNSPPVAAKNAP